MTEQSTPSLADLVAMMPFAAGMGIELQAATAEEVTGTMAWRPDLCTTSARCTAER